MPDPVIERRSGASIGIITVGGCDLAVREAIQQLSERGVEADYMRVRAFPFSEDVEKFLAAH